MTTSNGHVNNSDEVQIQEKKKSKKFWDIKFTDPKKKKDDKEKKEDASKEDTSTVSYYKLFRYASTTDKIFMLTGALCSFICGGLQPYMMIIFGDITGDIVNYVFEFNNETLTDHQKQVLNDNLYENIDMFIIETCCIGIVTIVTTYISTVLFSFSAAEQIFQMRKSFLAKTLNQDIEWHDLHQTGDFATTFTDNLAKVEDGIGEKIGIFLFFFATFVVGILMGLIRGWELALICLVCLPLSTVSMGFVAWLSSKFTKQEMESYSQAGIIAEEVFSSIRTVVAFDGLDKELSRYNVHLENAKSNNIRRSFFNALSNAFMWFFVFACYALSFWYGVGLIIKEKDVPMEDRTYTAGNMIAVFFSTLIASWNFGQLAPFFETFGAAKGAASKIFDVLDNEPVINKPNNSNNKTDDDFKADITFEDVFFNYPSRKDVKILQGLNLKIHHGETVALVGSSGCGKSTVIQLIQRFYDPEGGKVRINNRHIKDYDLEWLRAKIGVVGQEPALFDTSIANNIRYGNLSASEEEIHEAAKKANAHEFISKLPHGYKTVIGERGAQLSGGQKQRIAIARALVRKPEILLLDEATSALDTTSEAEVQEALDAISGECTTIIVAHRLSTIRNATRIVVLSEGNVIEEGTHAKLMEIKGAYYKLVESQGLTETTIDNNENNQIKSKRISLIKQTNYEHSEDDDKMTQNLDKTVQIEGSIARVLRLNKTEWFPLAVGLLCSIISGASLPVYGVIFGDIVGVLANDDTDELRNESNFYSLCFVIIGIVTGVAWFFQIFSFCYAGEVLTLRLRSRSFEAMLNQEMGWFDRKENGVGALCAQLSADAAGVQAAGGVRVGTIINSISTFLISCAFAFVYDWKLTLVLLSFAPLILISIYLEQRILQGNEAQNKKILEKSAKIAIEAISNIRTVVSLGNERVFCDIYNEELVPYVKICKRRCHFRGLVYGMARSLMLFAYAAGIAYGAKMIIIDGVDYGLVFKVCEVVITGSWSIGNALSFSPNFQKGLSATGRILTLLSREPLVKNITNPICEAWKQSTVNYSKIVFSYPTRPSVTVLKGLDLSIMDGKTVALVGSSGCGKSTIIQLLERYYDPHSGKLTIEDNNTKEVDLKLLRSQLGIVSQEPNLFDRTIAENIAYGANGRDVSLNEIIDAAKSANIHTFIASLPSGYDTRLGSKGAQLSGGQKQRIAIARALVRNPKILLLDEATSALDNESEKIVQEALDNAKQGRTCITIAHRLTTIQDADVICVLQEGRVVEMGKHKELLQKNGLYYKFYQLQSGAQ